MEAHGADGGELDLIAPRNGPSIDGRLELDIFLRRVSGDATNFHEALSLSMTPDKLEFCRNPIDKLKACRTSH